MTDHIVEVPKKVLSPAAQAVLDAAFSEYDCEALYSLTEEQHASKIAAAALSALAVRIKGADAIRQDILAIATELEGHSCHYSATLLTRAADLLQRQYPQPVPVSERLPEPNTKVLAYYFNSHGKGRTICAIWVPANSREVTGDDSFIISEPDEGCWTEGWYEQIENWEDLGWVYVYEGEVAYWQPLPEWPAYALPLPGAFEKTRGSNQ